MKNAKASGRSSSGAVRVAPRTNGSNLLRREVCRESRAQAFSITNGPRSRATARNSTLCEGPLSMHGVGALANAHRCIGLRHDRGFQAESPLKVKPFGQGFTFVSGKSQETESPRRDAFSSGSVSIWNTARKRSVPSSSGLEPDPWVAAGVRFVAPIAGSVKTRMAGHRRICADWAAGHDPCAVWNRGNSIQLGAGRLRSDGQQIGRGYGATEGD